jgi:hypothetical protein
VKDLEGSGSSRVPNNSAALCLDFIIPEISAIHQHFTIDILVLINCQRFVVIKAGLSNEMKSGSDV